MAAVQTIRMKRRIGFNLSYNKEARKSDNPCPKNYSLAAFTSV